MARGRLITVEGLDGAGKTTLVAGLAEALRRARVVAAGCASRAAWRPPSGSAALVKDPALTRRRPRRGPPVRGRPGPARRGARRAALAGGTLGPARPLRALLARLPGRGPRAGRRGRARRSTPSRSAASARPGRCSCGSTPRRAARGRPTAASRRPHGAGRRRVLRARSRAAYDALAAAEPERIVVLDASRSPDAVAGRR